MALRRPYAARNGGARPDYRRSVRALPPPYRRAARFASTTSNAGPDRAAGTEAHTMPRTIPILAAVLAALTIAAPAAPATPAEDPVDTHSPDLTAALAQERYYMGSADPTPPQDAARPKTPSDITTALAQERYYMGSADATSITPAAAPEIRAVDPPITPSAAAEIRTDERDHPAAPHPRHLRRPDHRACHRQRAASAARPAPSSHPHGHLNAQSESDPSEGPLTRALVGRRWHRRLRGRSRSAACGVSLADWTTTRRGRADFCFLATEPSWRTAWPARSPLSRTTPSSAVAAGG